MTVDLTDVYAMNRFKEPYTIWTVYLAQANEMAKLEAKG